MEATPQGDLHYSCRYEMLSNAKHPLASYTLSTQSLVGFEEILHFVQNDVVVCVIARRALPDVAISHY